MNVGMFNSPQLRIHWIHQWCNLVKCWVSAPSGCCISPISSHSLDATADCGTLRRSYTCPEWWQVKTNENQWPNDRALETRNLEPRHLQRLQKLCLLSSRLLRMHMPSASCQARHLAVPSMQRFNTALQPFSRHNIQYSIRNDEKQRSCHYSLIFLDTLTLILILATHAFNTMQRQVEMLSSVLWCL